MFMESLNDWKIVRTCNIHATIQIRAIHTHFHSNMQKYAKEFTRYETSTFVIEIILGEF